jgi:hypothetical protein
MGRMEPAQAGRLVVAFLGGSFSTAILNHLLTDRGARRTQLRPKDMERIAVVRTYVDAIGDARRITFTHRDETWKEMIERMRNMDAVRLRKSTNDAVVTLADRKLSKIWNRYEDDGWKSIGMLHDGKTLVHDGLKADKLLRNISVELQQRLNKLERRR